MLVLVEGAAVVVLAAAFWSVLVLGAVVVAGAVLEAEAALWSVVLVLEVEVEVLGAAALEAVALWSAELVPCAGGFTGALALSPCEGA